MTKKQSIPITDKQTEILLSLFKFRFLTTHHIQQLAHHKNPQRTQSWLKDLLDKKYIKRHFDPKTFQDHTKPAVYYLAPKSRDIIQKAKEIELSQLDYIYSEYRRKEKFIKHCLFLAEVYLYLYLQKDSTEDLKFFTKVDLLGYDYFPDPKPDAYISIKDADKARRYFLDFFDEYTPSWVIRQRVKNYLEYAEHSDWDENTDSTPFPSILIVCPNEIMIKHISKYSKAVFENNYEDNVKLFLTTKERIRSGKSEHVWHKV